MREEYNFKKSKKNPYIKYLKKQISIRLEIETINYFKSLSNETGITYQNLINMYLRDLALSKKKLHFKWAA